MNFLFSYMNNYNFYRFMTFNNTMVKLERIFCGLYIYNIYKLFLVYLYIVNEFKNDIVYKQLLT